MGGPNQVFGFKKHIFRGSAQKCTESMDFDINMDSSGWVAQIKFLGSKSIFSQDGPKSVQTRWILISILGVLGGWPKSSFWVQKADFPRIGPKVNRIDGL